MDDSRRCDFAEFRLVGDRAKFRVQAGCLKTWLLGWESTNHNAPPLRTPHDAPRPLSRYLRNYCESNPPHRKGSIPFNPNWRDEAPPSATCAADAASADGGAAQSVAEATPPSTQAAGAGPVPIEHHQSPMLTTGAQVLAVNFSKA